MNAEVKEDCEILSGDLGPQQVPAPHGYQCSTEGPINLVVQVEETAKIRGSCREVNLPSNELADNQPRVSCYRSDGQQGCLDTSENGPCHTEEFDAIGRPLHTKFHRSRLLLSPEKLFSYTISRVYHNN